MFLISISVRICRCISVVFDGQLSDVRGTGVIAVVACVATVLNTEPYNEH